MPKKKKRTVKRKPVSKPVAFINDPQTLLILAGGIVLILFLGSLLLSMYSGS